jgi:hypothetical protein
MIYGLLVIAFFVLLVVAMVTLFRRRKRELG